MIATCARPACTTITDNPDTNWVVLRPLAWNAFVEEITYCCPGCLVMDQTERNRPEVLS